VITIELTEAGQKMAEGAPPPIQEKIVNGLQSLKPGEIKQIINGLNMLTHMLDAQDLELEESTGRS
jgi:DNA-binding MarR family transcriptional regulator